MMIKSHAAGILLLVFTIETFFAPSARAYTSLHSELKVWKWHEATVLAAVSRPQVLRGQALFIRRKGNPKPLMTSFWPTSRQRQGLYIVIPGTGANPQAATANLLADRLTDSGFDVLIVTNPFSTEFQETFSSDGLIGFPQKDIRDAALMMNTAYAAYVSRHGKPKDVRLLGYSLGATYAGMFSQTKLNFPVSQYVLLNPPVRFGYAMNRLDEMLRDARNDDKFGLFELIDAIFPLFRMAADGITQDLVPSLRKRLSTGEYQNKHLIGASFAFDLTMITWGLKHTQAFSSNEDQVRMNGRLRRINFDGYLGLVGIALGNQGLFKGKTLQSLVDGMDLSRVMAGGKNRDKTVIVTNRDDFLLNDKDLRTLESLGASQFYVFDGGGHCGNYWTESYHKLLAQIAK